ncbi:hypothetical protein EDC01DRAFT_263399 [Geopyxis carbonaria]|nr:hypothetical protein EDC01DRAFT_263399 [Geopyxis carbonaria]
MSSTHQPPPAAPTAAAADPTPPEDNPLTPEHRDLLQRIINLYHKRLLAAWKAMTAGAEDVPDTHRSPPSIADWPREKVQKALANFREHMKWFVCVHAHGPGVGSLEDQLVELAERLARDDASGGGLENMLVLFEEHYEPVVMPIWNLFFMQRSEDVLDATLGP